MIVNYFIYEIEIWETFPTFMSLYRLVNSLVGLQTTVVNSANITRLSIVVQVAGKVQQVSH